jgi:hypothetical protein
MHPRYGALAGLDNPTFLDATLFEQAFLRVIEPWRQQVGVLIFEFGAFGRRSFADAAEFVKALDPFLSALPGGWRFAVEIRTPDFLDPRYFDCLRAHEATHVFNAWTRMPGISEQLAIPGSQTTELMVVRALLKSGRPYEDAVRMFSPYTRVQEVNEIVRGGLREIVDIAMVHGRPVFIFVNNRLEGNSPGTIVAITD